jgi:glyoxylase-like metal-dependent hydrolase (beta-lactamase superfamily II)
MMPEPIEYGTFRALRLDSAVLRLLGMSVYLYFDRENLIDTASASLRKKIIPVLPHFHFLERIHITHWHEDHSGNAAFFKSLIDVEIHAPLQSIPKLPQKDGFKLQPYRILTWGRIEPFDARPLPDTWKFGGMKMKTIHVPGHSFDQHVFFAEETGFLFSADLILLPRIYHIMKEEILADHIRSLKKIALLPVKKIFCAHRGVFEPDTLFRKLDFYWEIAKKVRELYSPGISIGHLTRKIAGNVKMTDILTSWHISRTNFIRQMIEIVRDEKKYYELFDY